MSNNYRVYQTQLPRLQAWTLETRAEVAEAFALITADKEHTYSIRWSIFSDTKTLSPKDFKLSDDRKGIFTGDGYDKLIAIQIGSTIVTSSNGTAYIAKPGYEDGEGWPDYLMRPYMVPLP